MFSRKLFLATAALFMIFGVTHQVWADDDDDDKGNGKGKKKDQSDPIGAWIGIARACPADPVTDSPVHAAFCNAICNGTCVNTGLLPPEIVLMPTIFEDGNLVEDDAAQIGITGTASNYHTTAHGRWTQSDNDGLVNRPGTDRIKGMFVWLGSGGQFTNSVRTRFVTYFDSDTPDAMLGYIQPYTTALAVGGQVVVQPTNPANPLAGNHVPATDPAAPLPAGCVVANGCLGTYHFVIRRVRAQ